MDCSWRFGVFIARRSQEFTYRLALRALVINRVKRKKKKRKKKQKSHLGVAFFMQPSKLLSYIYITIQRSLSTKLPGPKRQVVSFTRFAIYTA